MPTLQEIIEDEMRKAQRYGAERYIGPHMSQALKNVMALMEILGPQADMKGAVESSAATTEAVKRGDLAGALANLGMTGAEMADYLVPGNLTALGALMFGGRKAATANKDALAYALNREMQGASRDEIWKETGEKFGQPWMHDKKGGGWKFEIDDSGANWQGLESPDLAYGRLGKFLGHKDADKAYSNDLMDVDTKATFEDVPTEGSGYYQQFVDREAEGLFDIQPEIGVRAGSKDDLLSVALHEGQHRVQDLEGFARGGGVNTPEVQEYMQHFEANVRPVIKKEMNDLRDFLNVKMKEKMNNGVDVLDAQDQVTIEHPEIWARYKELSKKNEMDSLQAYMQLAGEAEARNVEKRRRFNMQDRINQPPWETLDVPEEELIYRFGD